MNILQIIDFANNGGAEREMCLIARELSLRGNNVYLLHPSGPGTNQFRTLVRDGIIVSEFPLKQKNFLKTIFYLRKFIKTNKIHIIHSHLYFSDFLAFVSCIGIKGVKHFITLHMYILNARPKIPIRKVQIYIFSLISYFFASRIFAVSFDLCEYTRKKFFVSKEKVVRVLNGLDFEQSQIDLERVQELKSQYDIRDSDIVLLNLGQINEEKGQRYIVDAITTEMKNNNNIKCFLLGSDGGLESCIKEKIRKSRFSNRIFLPGYQKDIWNWLYLCSIYVHPTLNDAMPLSLIEAMYLKKPVIISDLPTFTGFIENYKTGLIVRKKSSADIANAVTMLIEDRKLYNDIKMNAYTFVAEKCSIKSTVDQLIAYFKGER